MAITWKQQAFIDAYFECGMNATQAAIKAGYSPETARQQGSRLLTNVDIQNEIQRIFAENTLSAREVLSRLSEQGRADMADITDEEGMLDFRKAKAAGKTALIKSIKQTTITTEDSETHIIEVKLYDAQRALELLGKYHKLFTERVQIDTWESQAIEDIQAGRLDYGALVQAFDDEALVQDLFRKAGMKVTIQEDA